MSHDGLRPERVGRDSTTTLSSSALLAIKKAVLDASPVVGLTHQFYRYPARFSPSFARAVIQAFTDPGDVVLDPFVGGGTTLVEALVLGRLAVGSDISHLARFVSQTKLTPLMPADVRTLRRWIDTIQPVLGLGDPLLGTEARAPTNLDLASTWRLRRVLSLALDLCQGLKPTRRQSFARCVVLKTAQWALDGRRRVPTVPEFRVELRKNMDCMLASMREFVVAANLTDGQHSAEARRNWCVVSPASELHKHPVWKSVPQPRLILTSPPYAGIHVLYHRWQIEGRRETSAPFWITDSLDGHYASYYTFGDRKNEPEYFANAHAAFAGLAKVAGPDTIMVQLVGFSQPRHQLPAYLKVLEAAGFTEVDLGLSDRLWRQVPNRKWHADRKGKTAGSQEVVLVHKLRL